MLLAARGKVNTASTAGLINVVGVVALIGWRKALFA